MPQTNQFTKKRQVKRSFLVFGEGLGEVIFLKHLKNLYCRSDVSMIIRMGRGGTADGIIIEASKVEGDFYKKTVVLDNDRPKREMIKAQKEADKKNIKLFKNTPCLEFLLLSILDSTIPSGKGSGWYKKKFETEYISKRKRCEISECAKIFPKKLLNNKKSKVSSLKKMISIIKGD